MTYTAHIKNGLIVLDDSIKLPEGAKVTVDIADTPACTPISDVVKDLVDDSDELPADSAKNKRHYLYGHQKS